MADDGQMGKQDEIRTILPPGGRVDDTGAQPQCSQALQDALPKGSAVLRHVPGLLTLGPKPDESIPPTGDGQDLQLDSPRHLLRQVHDWQIGQEFPRL